MDKPLYSCKKLINCWSTRWIGCKNQQVDQQLIIISIEKSTSWSTIGQLIDWIQPDDQQLINSSTQQGLTFQRSHHSEINVEQLLINMLNCGVISGEKSINYCSICCFWNQLVDQLRLVFGIQNSTCWSTSASFPTTHKSNKLINSWSTFEGQGPFEPRLMPLHSSWQKENVGSCWPLVEVMSHFVPPRGPWKWRGYLSPFLSNFDAEADIVLNPPFRGWECCD